MDCPRCKMPLRREKYEGVPIQLCDECQGSWLGQKELDTVTESKGYKWANDERERILIAIAEASAKGKAAEDEDIGCPECAAKMEKVNFQGKSGILLDRCASGHGVWLDDGELKKVQVYAEAQPRQDPPKKK